MAAITAVGEAMKHAAAAADVCAGCRRGWFAEGSARNS